MQPADLTVLGERESISQGKTCSLWAIIVKKIHVSKVTALCRFVHQVNEVARASHTGWYVCTVKVRSVI
jgi:hypothetical protein